MTVLTIFVTWINLLFIYTNVDLTVNNGEMVNVFYGELSIQIVKFHHFTPFFMAKVTKYFEDIRK